MDKAFVTNITVRFTAVFLGLLVLYTLLNLLAFKSLASDNQHPKGPEPGTYKSSRMTSWLTATPYGPGDPRRGKYGPQVSYGVGSMPFKGLFGDLILHRDGTYTFTEDKHGGTWKYIPEKDSVAFTGWLAPFKTGYSYEENWITIYTGKVKMPDGGELNISYTKKREK
ncbi:hypothetical protein IC229_20345 [Spirosoma sp. BT702]|uniref:Uncharacterized protein n=1 Tax=Spirosoma profusum TaxID=2771354 RepID=A0A926Y323_9BACT|nr:hypothetical protein [Spirosoma profusum]MBD2703008.1 hypothetical protein [Spirosoma profusum]